jgi:RNA polymerase sigma-70 factor (ECF subfamily)
MGDLAGAIGIRSEDTALVAALKSGSEDAFAQLIALYHQPVYSLIARSLQDPADAADITQEVFIKIYRGIRGFHCESSLRTWIYRIALHEASNQRRWWSRHKRQEITIETDATGHAFDDDACLCLRDTLADDRISPFDAVAQDELRARVAAALSSVPEIFRTVLVLRELNGSTYDEIAEILGIQVGTVKSRLMRGRQALRLALAPLQPQPPQIFPPQPTFQNFQTLSKEAL